MADEHGILLVLDEVQTGFGHREVVRLRDYGVEPDVMVMGKSMANGLPLSAVGSRPHPRRWTTGAHGTTFGGTRSPAPRAANVDVLSGLIPGVPASQSRAFAASPI